MSMKRGYKWKYEWFRGQNSDFRKFELADGRSGSVNVRELSGGYYADLIVGDNALEADHYQSEPKSWGLTRKADAKALAGQMLRDFVKRNVLPKAA